MASVSADRVQFRNHISGNLKHRSVKVLAKMVDGRCSWDHQDIGRPMQKPSERNLHGRRVETRGDIGQSIRLKWSEPAEWKERHVGDAVTSKISYERIVGSMGEVVLVLYAHDWSDLPGFRDLLGRDV